MLRALALTLLLPLLAACGGGDNVYAPRTEVETRAYRAAGPATLTLLTAINNRSGGGAHSALMVSGSQRVVFDPAGTWRHPTAPERGDVIFGMTPQMLDFYIDYHARPTYRMVTQEITVPAEMAERALQLVQAHGSAPKATCGRSVSGILRELGFTQMRRTWFPDRVMRDFEKMPGVVRMEIYDDTVDESSLGRPGVIAVEDDGIVFEG